MNSEPNARTARRRYIGVVTSDKMDKTVVVSVDRLTLHPKFKKYVRSSTVLKAHDESDEARTGDKVEVVECRPLSKSKRFRLTRILVRAPRAAAMPEAGAET
ncbi:MAG TPA: 30S ribosomal protein S17 [Planctomycetota bacterium]|nr:30S ribosomal protein S17 [Planctomycetota bacterium]